MTKKFEEKAHNPGSDLHREGSAPDGERSFFDQITDTADKVIDEAARLGQTALEKENRPKVAAGAAVGAVTAAVLPFVSIPLGLLAGAGYVAYREANKRG